MGWEKRYCSPFLILTFTLLAFSGGAKTDHYRCMWRTDPATTMVVAWSQISGQNPVLYYDAFDGGTDPQLYSQQQEPDRVVHFKGLRHHFVRLRGLQANTIYYFLIVDSEGQSRRLSFRTAPDDPHERLSIIAGGDSRNYRDARRRANLLVAKLHPHCVLFGGDMTGGDTDREWREWLDDWQHTISPEGHLTPIVATRGNHEYSNRTIVEIFDVPHPQVYYSLSLGGKLLQVFTLNSLIAAGGSQKEWLARELSTSPQRWKMAQYHYGMRPHTHRKSERNTQLVHWGSLFYEHQVNLVVESDAHVVKTTWPIRPSRESGSDEGFIRDDERGTVYVGEGCWGAPLRRNNDDKQWTRNSGSFNQFKWIFVDWDKIEVRTVKTDNAEEVAEVSPYDIFSPPARLDLWKPSHGAVLYLYPRATEAALALAAPTSRDAEPWTASQNAVLSATAEPPRTPPIEISGFAVKTAARQTPTIEWHSKGEHNGPLVYEVQRSADGKNFRTIAAVKAQGGGGGQYRIPDAQWLPDRGQSLHYRLRFKHRGQWQEYRVRSDWAVDDHPWRDLPELLPNLRTGQLQVKYRLAQSGPVNIRLVNLAEKVVSVSDYPQQPAGNYLKTIDLAIFPRGLYLLIIKVNEEQVERYQVLWK
ncbi:MAG: fibronectin type III domain-containing protein [Bacteroidota bacterium]